MGGNEYILEDGGRNGWTSVRREIYQSSERCMHKTRVKIFSVKWMSFFYKST